MSVKQTESKITALYERLSRDDDNAGDNTSPQFEDLREQVGTGHSLKA